MGLALFLLIAAGATQGVSILMLIPLLQAVGIDVDQGATRRIAEAVAGVFTAVGIRPTLGAVLVVYIGITGLQALLVRWQLVTGVAVQHGFVRRLRERLYRGITYSQWSSFTRQRSSDLAHCLTDELDRVDEAASSLLSLAYQAFVAAVYLLLAFHISPPLSGLALASGAALWLLLQHRNSLAHSAGEETSRAVRDLFAAVADHLGGMKTTRSYAVEDRNVLNFSRISRRVEDVQVAATRTYADTSAWLKIGSVSILSLILYIAVMQVGLSAAGLLVLLVLFARLVPKISSIQEEYQYLMTVLPAFTAVWATIRRNEAAADASRSDSSPVVMQTGVHLDHVSFSYEGGIRAVADVDMFIPVHGTVALVGPSGAGKTTLADLLVGLIHPDHGRLTVDGVPLPPGRMGAWRERIGYVPQDTFLTNDTLRANLQWISPSASEPALWEALQLAAADDFVRRLPEGLGTIVGDRGVRLSGGERQRIALARALLRRPALLILDEATSALDSEHETRIQQAIERLHGRMTILIITHRLSTARRADIIYVVDDGRVVESGSWEELTACGRRFAEICAAQDLRIVSAAPGDAKPVTV